MFGKLFGKKTKKRETADNIALLHGVDGVDPGMNYCPVCGDEYRAASKRCAACDVDLITGGEKLDQVMGKEQVVAGRSMVLSVDDELVTLRKGALNDMKHLKALLGKERIPSILAGDEKTCSKGCCGPEMYLQVRESDTETALAVLAQDFIESTSLSGHDLTNVDAVYVHEAESNICPACGCQFPSDEQMNCPECGLCFG